MVSLLSLLKEIVSSSPKAIFMAGPAGSGKTYTLNQLGVKGFEVINVDEDYEKLLTTTLGKSDFASMTPEELSIAAKLMGKARVTTKEKEELAKENLKDIIIDGTGAASRPLLKKKNELESLGYETFMILIYASPMTTLQRNIGRKRSLATPAVISSWEGLVSNLNLYREEFGNNIVIINKDPEDADKSFDPAKIRKLFPSPKGKPKTPEERAKSQARKEKTYQNISQLLTTKKEFDDFEVAKNKVNNFLNG